MFQNQKSFFICAVTHEGVFGAGSGAEGIIPWKSDVDMGFFVKSTSKKTVIMSRGMYLSIPAQFRPLRNRQNIILTSDHTFEVSEEEKAKGVLVVHSFEDAKKTAQNEELYYSGGQEFFLKAIDHVDVVLLNVLGIPMKRILAKIEEKRKEDGIARAVVYFEKLLSLEIYWPKFRLEKKDGPVTDTPKDGSNPFSVEMRRYVRV